MNEKKRLNSKMYFETAPLKTNIMKEFLYPQ